MRALFLFVVLAIAAPAAHADYKAEYQAFRQALTAGDYAKVAAHGEAAWRAAEKEIGDSKATAVLAFNYAEHVVINSPQEALEPYARARAISAKTTTGLVMEDIDAGAAYAQLALRPEDKTLRMALETALDARRARSLPASPVSAYGWLSLVRFDWSADDKTDALRFADRALADAEAMGAPVDPVLMRTSLISAAVLRVSRRNRDADSVGQAVAYLDRSFQYFPPQVSIDAFDPMLARAVVWRTSIYSLARSEGAEVVTGSRLPQGEDFDNSIEANATTRIEDWIKWRDPYPDTCPRVEWTKKPKVKFPDASAARNILGASLIGYELSGKGVSRAVVLGETYDSGFGAAAVKAMKDWETRDHFAPACAKNHTLTVSFGYE